MAGLDIDVVLQFVIFLVDQITFLGQFYQQRRKVHTVLRRREETAARQRRHQASALSAALCVLGYTRLPGKLALFGGLRTAFICSMSKSWRISMIRRVGVRYLWKKKKCTVRFVWEPHTRNSLTET